MPTKNERRTEWWKYARVQLSRILELVGIREAPDPAGDSGDTRPENLVIARTFRQMGDAALASTDQVHPGEQYVAAIRLYGEALALVRATAATTNDPPSADSPLKDPIQSVAKRRGVPVSQIEGVLHASASELLGIDADERRALAFAMQDICDHVLGEILRDAWRAAGSVPSRYIRVAVAAITLLGMSTLATQYWNMRTDLARGKPTRASSALGICLPIDEGGCPMRPEIFFHTTEEDNPWIEYDLGQRTKFSRILVENARDGFRDRAVPLVIEIGDDQTNWTEVARITGLYELWTPAFPAVSARFVRFRVPRVTYLHLTRIEIRR